MAYDSFARIMQQRLQAHGFDIGKSGVDGIAGKLTRGALRKFQEAMNLPATGTATRATMTALLKAPTPKPRMRPMQPDPRSEARPPPPAPAKVVSAPTADPALDFNGPQPPSRPDLQGALDRKAMEEGLRQKLWEMMSKLRIQQQQQAPPPEQPAAPPPPRPAQSQLFPWSI